MNLPMGGMMISGSFGSSIRFHGILLLLLISVGCSTVRKEIHEVTIDPSARAQGAVKTAFLALVITSHTDHLNSRAEILGATDRNFYLDITLPSNPFSTCPAYNKETKAIEVSKTSPGGATGGFRQAKTLLEAYCVYSDKLDLLDVFEQEPTAFGGKNSKLIRSSIQDSLTMVAHSYVLESIENNCANSGIFGDILPHEEVLGRLITNGQHGLYSQSVVSHVFDLYKELTILSQQSDPELS